LETGQKQDRGDQTTAPVSSSSAYSTFHFQEEGCEAQDAVPAYVLERLCVSRWRGQQ